MDHGVYVATSGFLTQQKRLEIIANNIANANTPGYKGDAPVFQTYHAAAGGLDRGQPWPAWPPYFPALTGQAIDFSQGPLTKTQNPLDLAITGEGFFEIQTPRGLRYTRKGDFAVAEDGALVTRGDHPVMGEGGSLVLTEGEIEIDGEGNISVDGTQRGQVRVVTFPGNENLVREEDGMFAWVGRSSQATRSDQVEVRQGYLESSNVNPIREMVHMIDAIRTYEVQQKVIRSFDDTRKKVVDEVGRLR